MTVVAAPFNAIHCSFTNLFSSKYSESQQQELSLTHFSGSVCSLIGVPLASAQSNISVSFKHNN
jgi:hypothetical protein